MLKCEAIFEFPRFLRGKSGPPERFPVFLQRFRQRLSEVVFLPDGMGAAPVGGDLGEVTCGKRCFLLSGIPEMATLPQRRRFVTAAAELDARWPDLKGSAPMPPAPLSGRRCGLEVWWLEAPVSGPEVLEAAGGWVRPTGSARPKPKVVISPLHLLEFTSERRMCLEDANSAAEVRTRIITAPRFPSSIRLASANASVGGHAIQHAVEILVL